MSVSIITKYLGPTNTKGSRIKATGKAGSVTVAYDYGLSLFENCEAAAAKLAAVNNWRIIAGAWLPASDTTAVFICD